MMRTILPSVFLACFLACSTLERVAAQTVDFAVYDSFAQLEQRICMDTSDVLILNFWATWCRPCVEELPYFEQLKQKYAGKSVTILLVSLDFKSQKEKRLRPFLLANPMHSEVALLADQDANTWIPQMDSNWDGAIPVTLVLNRKENQRGFHKEVFENYEALESFVLQYF